MDVIGNNIANVNTTGFKDGRYEFQDILSQSVRGAAPPAQAGIGGTNAEQIGMGTTTGSIQSDTTQGSLQQTNLPTDVAIQGQGYFILGDGNNLHYSRNGVFHIDGAGNLVSSDNGLHVMGTAGNPDGTLNVAGGLRNLTIPQTINQALNTTAVDLFGNLDSRATTPVTQDISVFDSLGQSHTVALTFTPNGTGGTGGWTVAASSPDLNNGGITVGNNALTFNSAGTLTGGGPLTLTFAGTPWNISGTGTLSNATQAATTLTLNDGAVGNLTSFALASAVSSQAAPANPAGPGNSAAFLKSFSIGADGTIRGSYANGTVKSLGQIQLSTFTNPGGLQRIGQNDFDVSSDSGQANITNPGSGSSGTVAQGSIETSNVQLADQLSGMILAERGFQANSRMITTSDEMLQDVVQMKR